MRLGRSSPRANGRTPPASRMALSSGRPPAASPAVQDALDDIPTPGADNRGQAQLVFGGTTRGDVDASSSSGGETAFRDYSTLDDAPSAGEIQQRAFQDRRQMSGDVDPDVDPVGSGDANGATFDVREAEEFEVENVGSNRRTSLESSSESGSTTSAANSVDEATARVEDAQRFEVEEGSVLDRGGVDAELPVEESTSSGVADAEMVAEPAAERVDAAESTQVQEAQDVRADARGDQTPGADSMGDAGNLADAESNIDTDVDVGAATDTDVDVQAAPETESMVATISASTQVQELDQRPDAEFNARLVESNVRRGANVQLPDDEDPDPTRRPEALSVEWVSFDTGFVENPFEEDLL